MYNSGLECVLVTFKIVKLIYNHFVMGRQVSPATHCLNAHAFSILSF